MQALVDASPSFRDLVDRIKAEDPDAKLDSKTLVVSLFWFSRALADDDVVQKDLSGDKPYAKLLADISRTTKDGKSGFFRESNKDSNEERALLKAFPELEGGENKYLLVALLNVAPAFEYVKKVIKAGTSGVAVADVVDRLQTHVRDAYVKYRKSVRTLTNESLARKLKYAMANYAKILKSSGESSSTASTTVSSGKVAPGDAEAEKIRAVQKQQFTGAVTREFMTALAETGSTDMQQMLGGIDTRAKQLAAHTMSVTFLLTESFRAFSEVLTRINPGRLLREYEKIVEALEPIAPNERRKAAAALELERAYAVTRQDVEEEFARLQDRVALTLERVDRVRAETLGSQYTWEAT